jgi:glycosyltransferase involved in cell wall biosynthesis
MTTRLTIVMPVFNDWESFRCLLTDLAACLSERDCTVAIVAVDDCSVERPPATLELASPIIGASILRLSANLGHQRAIAVGLASIAARDDIDMVAVMDSDGEDRPDELVRLIDSATAHPNLRLSPRGRSVPKGSVSACCIESTHKPFAFSPGSASISGIFAFCLLNTWSGS